MAYQEEVLAAEAFAALAFFPRLGVFLAFVVGLTDFSSFNLAALPRNSLR